MRYLALFLKIVLFVLLLGFAVKNSEIVTLRYFFGYERQSPMALVILVSFAIGLLVGLLACSWRLLRNHRELRQLRRLTSVQSSVHSKPD
jgi:putative membrane protein